MRRGERGGGVNRKTRSAAKTFHRWTNANVSKASRRPPQQPGSDVAEAVYKIQLINASGSARGTRARKRTRPPVRAWGPATHADANNTPTHKPRPQLLCPAQRPPLRNTIATNTHGTCLAGVKRQGVGGEALPALQRRNGTACDGKALRNQTGQQRYHADSPASNRARHTHSTVSLTSKGKGAAVSVSRREGQRWERPRRFGQQRGTRHTARPAPVERTTHTRLHTTHSNTGASSLHHHHTQSGIYKPLIGGGTAGYKRVIHSWHAQLFPTACIATEPRTIAHFVQLRAASPP